MAGTSTPIDTGATADQQTTSNNNNSEATNSSSPSNKYWGKDGSVNDYSRFENIDDPESEGPLAEALRCKERGNAAFKEKNYKEAIKHYTEVLSVANLTAMKLSELSRCLRSTLLTRPLFFLFFFRYLPILW